MSDAKQQKFLEELTGLLMRASTGRLDVRVEVRGDETGPLADAANHALGSFRGLVLEFRSGTERLLHGIERTRERGTGIATVADEARTQLTATTAAAQELLAASQRGHNSAEQCREVATRSLELVREARNEAQQASAELDRMRSSMNETGKRLKRLAESCQEVGDATRAIDDVADHTGVLAVNAAIQSSIAGNGDDEGFGIIVEEIRRLSERARTATREIESLVRAIQSDSAEAVKAAEQATGELVSASDTGDRAGATLRKAEQVSQSLANAVEGISGQLARQGQRAEALAGEVGAVDRGLSSLQGDAQAVSTGLEQLAEAAMVLHQAQEPFQVADDAPAPAKGNGKARGDDDAAAGQPKTAGGTLVLKPAQLKAARSARAG